MANIYTDYNGNVVDCTYEEALKNKYNINCTNCKNCTNCIDCTNCTDCKNCTDCLYCTNCLRCTNCTNCKSCKDCTKCTNCIDCTDCKNCTDCVDCNNCDNCTEQPILNTPTSIWTITYRTNHTLQIGCQDHNVVSWLTFSDEKIDKMASEALEFWAKWKPIIEGLYSIHYVIPTRAIKARQLNQ
jgi:hypothetical protein